MLISKVRGSPLSEMMAGMQNLNWIRSNFQYLIKHSSIWLCSEWAHTDNIYRIFKRLLELNLFHTVLQEAKLNGGQLEEPSRSQNRSYEAYFIAWKWIHHKIVNWQLTWRSHRTSKAKTTKIISIFYVVNWIWHHFGATQTSWNHFKGDTNTLMHRNQSLLMLLPLIG